MTGAAESIRAGLAAAFAGTDAAPSIADTTVTPYRGGYIVRLPTPNRPIAARIADLIRAECEATARDYTPDRYEALIAVASPRAVVVGIRDYTWQPRAGVPWARADATRPIAGTSRPRQTGACPTCGRRAPVGSGPTGVWLCCPAGHAHELTSSTARAARDALTAAATSDARTDARAALRLAVAALYQSHDVRVEERIHA